MTITMTNVEMLQAIPVLRALAKRQRNGDRLTFREAMHAAEIVRTLTPHALEYEEQRLALLDRYTVREGEGEHRRPKPVIGPTGLPDPEKVEISDYPKYNMELHTLATTGIPVTVRPLTFDEVEALLPDGDFDITPILPLLAAPEG